MPDLILGVLGDVLDALPFGDDNEKFGVHRVLHAKVVIDTGDMIPEAMVDPFTGREMLSNAIAELRFAILVAENAQQAPATKGMAKMTESSV